MRTFVVLSLLGLLVPASLVAAEGAAESPFHGIVLTDTAGKKVPMDSLLSGGPVVLNFWATWCGPCRREMPNLEKVFKEVGPKGVSFAAVSLDTRVSKEAMDAFLKRLEFTLPVYRDDGAVLARMFKVSAIPATFVLKPTGEIFYQTKGYRPGDEILLQKKVEELVAAAKPVTAKQD
jgi:thiol-disulfide isomerase/thioredoxin